MNLNDFCGIAVTATLLVAIAMFVALLYKLNQQPRRNLSKLEQLARGEGAAVTSHRP